MRHLALIALAACGTAPAVTKPHASVPVVVVISANAEWKALALHDARVSDTPHGEWLTHKFGDRDVVFFHGGYGKVAAGRRRSTRSSAGIPS